MTDYQNPSGHRDQAAELRALAREHAGGAMTIAVTSGKGGVGKTNLAVNVAICLAAKGWRVGLLDADFGLANVDVLLDLDAQYNLSHVLAGQCQIDEVAILALPNRQNAVSDFQPTVLVRGAASNDSIDCYVSVFNLQ